MRVKLSELRKIIREELGSYSAVEAREAVKKSLNYLEAAVKLLEGSHLESGAESTYMSLLNLLAELDDELAGDEA
jgi:hypothetical protein